MREKQKQKTQRGHDLIHSCSQVHSEASGCDCNIISLYHKRLLKCNTDQVWKILTATLSKQEIRAGKKILHIMVCETA